MLSVCMRPGLPALRKRLTPARRAKIVEVQRKRGIQVVKKHAKRGGGDDQWV